MIVICDTLGAYGGSHTLMLRMCQWMHDNNIKSAIICKSNSNTEIVERLKEFEVQVICADLADARAGRKIFRDLAKTAAFKVINFSWNFYMDVERIKKIYKLEFDNMLYCIHPETFKKGIGFKNAFLKNYSKFSYRKIFERMNNNHAIVSLDEINIEESERYLGCILTRKPRIIRLPMYCPERKDAEDIIRRGFMSNTLLTAARADIPYKGYMIGLIDDFVELKNKYHAMKLEIVSSGDDYEQLLDKINSISEKIRKDIVLHSWMEYERLKAKMCECRMFIGMGTSVFDAALQYKPSVVVLYSTFENISDHFVAERPEYMSAEPGSREKAISRIDAAMGWEFEEYHAQCMASFQAVKNIYDVNICMRELAGCTTQHKESVLSYFECARHNLNHMLNKVRFRGRNFADYNQLSREAEVANE